MSKRKQSKRKHLYIIYDQRAKGGDPDDALVLDSADTLVEAVDANKALRGVIYKYELIGGEAKNGKMLDP